MPKVIITGGTKGIGKATAKKFAENNYDVVVTYAHDDVAAKETESFLQTFGVSALAIKADSSKKEDLRNLFSKVDDASVLINNIGAVFPSGGKTDRETMFHYHLMGTVNATELFADSIKEKGTIVNVSSVLGQRPDKRYKAMRLESYCCVKAAVDMYTKLCANKHKGRIWVNAVSPGNTQTPSRTGASPEMVNERKNNSCIKRFIKPEEIAEAIYALTQNRGINGQILTVDGGEVARGYE